MERRTAHLCEQLKYILIRLDDSHILSLFHSLLHEESVVFCSNLIPLLSSPKLMLKILMTDEIVLKLKKKKSLPLTRQKLNR